ncbi:hypothetical protein, partial [Vibrio chemaguriensis]
FLTSFLKQTARYEPTWPPDAPNLKRIRILPCPMRQPDKRSTSALSFQPKRRTMLNYRGNCQADKLLGKKLKATLSQLNKNPTDTTCK